MLSTAVPNLENQGMESGNQQRHAACPLPLQSGSVMFTCAQPLPLRTSLIPVPSSPAPTPPNRCLRVQTTIQGLRSSHYLLPPERPWWRPLSLNKERDFVKQKRPNKTLGERTKVGKRQTCSQLKPPRALLCSQVMEKPGEDETKNSVFKKIVPRNRSVFLSTDLNELIDLLKQEFKFHMRQQNKMK